MTYYHYKGIRGERFFRVSPISAKVVQVCVSSGEIKRGRTNNIGITLIDKNTLTANYSFFKDEIKECTEKQFLSAKDRVLKILV